MIDKTNLALITNKVSILVKQASLLLKKPLQTISDEANPSTNIDSEISEFLSDSLFKVYPANIVSEEDHKLKSKIAGKSWVIDPIDGTINFISGSPDIAISIALVDDTFSPLLSVIFLPFFNQLFTAQKNRGAKLNGKLISYSNKGSSIISVGIPGDSIYRFDQISDDIKILIKSGYVLRQSGSATVDICRVANGIWHGFFEKGLYLWDVVAADLIAREAGCVSQVSIINNNYKCNYIVSNSLSLYQNLTNQLKWKV